MSQTKKMQEKDARIFRRPELIREGIYRGADKTLLTGPQLGGVQPKDNGARPLLTKFSTFNLRHYTPEQRKVLVEQIRFELSLPAHQRNEYIDARYTPDDMLAILELIRKPRTKSMGQKRRVSNSRKGIKLTPEQRQQRYAKALATKERNKSDPNYVSYATIKTEFLRLQKQVAKRAEAKLKAQALLGSKELNRAVYRRTMKLERENTQLKEYLRQNNMPLPGTAAAKKRREQLRSEDD